MGRILTNIIEHVRTVAIRILIPDRNRLGLDGLVKIRELPYGCEMADFLEMWEKMTPREKERMTVYEHHNTITSAGRTQALTYLSSSTATTLGFAQYFAVGTFPINSVSPGDTSVQTEIFRAVPQTITITGTQADVATMFGSAQANGTYTNCGLYGINATSTSGSGSLMTHSIYQYTKANGQAIVNDYLLNLQ